MSGQPTRLATLFRAEAKKPNNQRVLGEVVLNLPVRYRVICLVVLLFLLAFTLLLFFGSYARREIAPGILVPQDGFLTLINESSGTLSKLLVTEGQQVKAGELLGVVSSNEVDEHGMRLNLKVQRAMHARIAALETRQQQARQIAHNARNKAKNQIELIRLALERLSESQVQSLSKIALLESKVQNMQNLARKGYVSSIALEEEKLRLVDARSQHATLTFERAAQALKLRDLELEVSDAFASYRSTKADFKRQQSELRQQLAIHQAQSDRHLIAPAAGTISLIQYQLGKAVPPGARILSVVPLQSTLVADVFVDAGLVGNLAPSQEVNLRYAALPYQRFGVQKGTIAAVTRVPVSSDDLPAALALGNSPVYKIQIALQQPAVSAATHVAPLQAGMVLEADFFLERRKLWSWLIKPVAGNY